MLVEPTSQRRQPVHVAKSMAREELRGWRVVGRVEAHNADRAAEVARQDSLLEERENGAMPLLYASGTQGRA